MIDNTTLQLIADIRRMGSIPASQSLYSDQDFIDAMNDYQRSSLISKIMKVREEFFVATVDIPMVSGQRDYDIPERAVGQKVRQIIMVDSQGNEVRLPRVEPENATWHENYIWWPGTKAGYLFENNKIHLTPNLDNTYNFVRVKYFRRPNRLCRVETAGHITNISVGATLTTFALDKLPNGWTSGRRVDLIQERPPFASRKDSVAVQGVSSSPAAVSLLNADAVGLVVGDWICDEGETVIPQYPEELHPIMTNFVLIDVLKHLGDTQGAQNASDQLAEMENDLLSYISNRDEASPRKVFSRRGIWDTGGI